MNAKNPKKISLAILPQLMKEESEKKKKKKFCQNLPVYDIRFPNYWTLQFKANCTIQVPPVADMQMWDVIQKCRTKPRLISSASGHNLKVWPKNVSNFIGHNESCKFEKSNCNHTRENCTFKTKKTVP